MFPLPNRNLRCGRQKGCLTTSNPPCFPGPLIQIPVAPVRRFDRRFLVLRLKMRFQDATTARCQAHLPGVHVFHQGPGRILPAGPQHPGDRLMQVRLLRVAQRASRNSLGPFRLRNPDVLHEQCELVNQRGRSQRDRLYLLPGAQSVGPLGTLLRQPPLLQRHDPLRRHPSADQQAGGHRKEHQDEQCEQGSAAHNPASWSLSDRLPRKHRPAGPVRSCGNHEQERRMCRHHESGRLRHSTPVCLPGTR